jgi:hypothetical protein
VRPRDEHIAPEEDLYRRIRFTDVLDGMSLLSVVDSPQTSVNRSSYSGPRSVLTPARPEYTGVAVVRGADLPSGPLPSPGGVKYEVFTSDDPIPENSAHANIVVGRITDQRNPKGHKPDKKEFRDHIRGLIARGMRIEIAPKGPSSFAGYK